MATKGRHVGKVSDDGLALGGGEIWSAKSTGKDVFLKRLTLLVIIHSVDAT